MGRLPDPMVRYGTVKSRNVSRAPAGAPAGAHGTPRGGKMAELRHWSGFLAIPGAAYCAPFLHRPIYGGFVCIEAPRLAVGVNVQLQWAVSRWPAEFFGTVKWRARYYNPEF